MNEDLKCGQCGHPFSAHTRDVLDMGTVRADGALLSQKPGDIFSSKRAGESGCTACPCGQWKPVGYGVAEA